MGTAWARGEPGIKGTTMFRLIHLHPIFNGRNVLFVKEKTIKYVIGSLQICWEIFNYITNENKNKTICFILGVLINSLPCLLIRYILFNVFYLLL